MARADTVTLLGLDRYAKVMALNPIHFNNLDDGTYPDACRNFWDQDNHDELARGIKQAEDTLRDFLGYNVAPVWHEDEGIDFSYAKRRGKYWQWTTQRTQWGYLRSFGRREKTEIDSDVATGIIDGDTTVIITQATTVTDEDEIRVYYRVTDGAPDAANDAWQIRGLTVAISAGTATITGPVELFVLPSVMDDADPADYTLAASYVTAVDIYRVYNDPELPVTLMWMPPECASTNAEGYLVQNGAGRIVDAKLGYFEPFPATYNSTTGVHTAINPTYLNTPDLLEIDYRAGHPLDGANIDRQLEEAVIHLANTLMPTEPCAFCDLAQRKWKYDRDPVEPMTIEAASNPFGFTNGALWALRIARRRRILLHGGL